ncbi:MAG TPA: ABC transporter permease [Acidobacteriota bacterium]|nr:ABC transporter permease [Acidobacteriota bacterium]
MSNLKAAVRSLLSTPGPTLAVILTLAVAIGANTAIFSVVEGVLLSPLGYGEEDQLVVVWALSESQTGETFRLSPADYRDLREGTEAFSGQVALYRSIGSTLTGLEEPARVGSLSVTPRLFSVLRAQPATGQFFTEEAETPGHNKQVVITHACWMRRFGGDPSIIGSAIELDSEPYTLVGVAQEGFEFPPGNSEVELYFPMAFSNRVMLDRDHRMFDSVARLGPGVTLDGAKTQLQAMAAQLAREFPDSNQGWSLTARPLRQELLGDLSTTLWVLSCAVFLVLLIACANIANVLVARSSKTRREIAVRAALGARGLGLYHRSLAESLVLGLVGGGLGIPLAYWGVMFLRGFLPRNIPRVESIGLDAPVLLFAAGLTLACTLLFGLLAALRTMTPDLSLLLKTGGSSSTQGGGGVRVRQLLVMVEVALAIVLLVGAGLVMTSFWRLTEIDPGFRQQDVVSVAVKLPGSRYSRDQFKPFFQNLVDRIGQLPGIEAAGAVSDLPMSDIGLGFEMEFSVPGLDAASPSSRPNAEFRLVLPGYFQAMGMKMVQGRPFERLDAEGERVAGIVNQTLVRRYLSGVNPIGRKLNMAMLGEVEIVGVVADIRHQGLQSKYESEVYLPYGRISTAEMHVVAQSGLESSTVSGAILEVLGEMDPQLAPSRVAAISDLLWEATAQPRFNTALLSGLALCAAFLALIGIYGIVAYSVSQRRREIGLRLALGADGAAMQVMVVRQALTIVLAGAALGFLAALGATRFLGQLLFQVRPTDPATYAAVLAAVILVGALSAWMPARRATRIDPVKALRVE